MGSARPSPTRSAKRSDLPLKGEQEPAFTSPLEGEVAGAGRGSGGWGGCSPPRPLARAAFLFISLALLVAPLFAHGCHGDDIDHEPLLIPLRSNPEDR
jgi:hypothetical protein